MSWGKGSALLAALLGYLYELGRQLTVSLAAGQFIPNERFTSLHKGGSHTRGVGIYMHAC